jgi:hypothetical protein
MSAEQLERLRQGIVAADAEGNEDDLRVLAAEYRRLQAQMGGTQSPPQQAPQQAPRSTVFSDFGTAFTANVDPILNSMGQTANVLGAPNLGGWLEGLTEMPEGYESSSERFMNREGQGFNWSALPGAAGEQVGQWAGSLASRVGGAAVGALAGPVGATAGAFAGPAFFEATQVVGPVAMERARNNGRETPNTEDLIWAFTTAAGSGALNAIAPQLGVGPRRAVTELATEYAQAYAQQTGESLGTDAGLQLDHKGALGEGIIGGTTAAVTDTAIGGVQRVGEAIPDVSDLFSRTDSRPFTEDERRAAQRLLEAADGDRSVLGNVDDRGQGTALGAANAALRGLQAEAQIIASDLRDLARHVGDRDAEVALRSLLNTTQNQSSATPENFLRDLQNAYKSLKSGGHIPHEDITRIGSIARQINIIQDFTSGHNRDIGGLSQFTNRWDILDKRSRGGLGGIAVAAGGSFGTAGTAIATNRVARAIDRFTNRRSQVKRFVDSALKDGRTARPINGDTARDALDRLKQNEAAERAAQQFMLDQAKEKEREARIAASKQATADRRAAETKAREDVKAQRTQTELAHKEAKAQRAAEEQAQRYKLGQEATAPVFETGEIPEGDPFFNTYRYMQEQTGLNPEDALNTIEQLEREGVVPKGTAERFVSDPLSFGQDVPETMTLQRVVRNRANPNFRPTPKTPDGALKKLEASSTGLGGEQAAFKAREGKRRKLNLVSSIEGSKRTLNSKQYQQLLDLAEAIDSSEVTRAERFQMVNQHIPRIFRGNPAMSEFWKKEFGGLAAIGNDKKYTRKSEEQIEDARKDSNLEKAVEKAVKRQKRNKKPAEPKPDLAPAAETPADRALRKLTAPKPANSPEPPQTPAAEAQKAEEPTPPPPANPPAPANSPNAPTTPKAPTATGEPKPSTGTTSPGAAPSVGANPTKPPRVTLERRVMDRIAQIEHTIELAAEKGDALREYAEKLPHTVEGRIERMFYEMATDRIMFDQLVKTFGDRFQVPPHHAAKLVDNALSKMEADGKIKRVLPFKNNYLKRDGDYVRDADGKKLNVLQVEFVDPELKARMEVAKAIRQESRLVPQEAPDVDFTPEAISDGAFNALKDIDPSRVDESFAPILNFLNSMRHSRLAVSDRMLTQIEDALGGTGDKRVGTVAEVLTPKVGERYRDDGPLNTVAQLLFQVGTKGERSDTTIRQEWGAGANLRVYSKNGLAHTQAGDIMKGVLRTPERHKLGGEKGLQYTLHGIGNLLGFDKAAPADRRNAIFSNDLVDPLVKFASDPFGRLTMKDRNGQPTDIAKMVNKGEGFFQVLNAANEVKDMVDFARARHPDKAKLTNSQLLQDPAVQQDLATNYETDFIVQLDAANNAYQIAGMVMGYEDVLRATGLLPRQGFEGDPDGVVGADIYMEPALDITMRVPELQALVDSEVLSNSNLRKIFKKPISTYLYAATFNSREKAFRDSLKEIAGDAEVIGIDGDGLIQIPEETLKGLRSPEGALFSEPKYDVEGNVKKTRNVLKRVVKDGDKFKVEQASVGKNGKQANFKGGMKFATEAEAIRYAYEMDLFLRMNDELIRDMNTRYPGMREYLNFAETVAGIVKSAGGESVKVPTIDGMMLEYSFKQQATFEAHETNLNGKVLRLGVERPDYKLAGRGLAAFMTHQNDAWALRETHRQMEAGGEMKGFNPIHDSYGFHPSDAQRGQETWVQTMQQLGSEDYNLFLMILEANGIGLQEFRAAGGNPAFVLGRKGVAPVDPKQIPTALS